MKSLILFIFLAASSVFAQDGIARFKYSDKKAIPVGTVLHYVKTNIDGSKPEYVSQYIASRDSLESFKFHIKGDRAGFVVAHMDWRNFAAAKLESWRLKKGDKRELFGTIDFDFEKKEGRTLIPSVSAVRDTFSMPSAPVHLYNFDLASLNFALPHLRDIRKPLVFGIADPTFGASTKLVEFKGDVKMAFVSEERRNEKKTRKYSLDGPGLQNRGGFIWVNKKNGWMEDVEVDLPDNPDWQSFKLKLLRIEKMTREQWDKFRDEQF